MPFLSGGFVGVDIFFVISGFLISSIILNEAREGRFSIIRFYERRIRRLLPALVAVLLAIFGVALIYAVPGEMAEIGRTTLAALLFVSNIYFWQKSGYFDVAAKDQPLLHTWSLAVEEQFYLLAPITILLLIRFVPRQLGWVVLVAATASLLLSIVALPYGPTATFYLLPTRAWELLIGTMLALAHAPLLTSAPARNIASAAGLLMIAAAVVLYSPSTPFPGVAALLPCAGAALIIAAGQGGPSLVGRLLSTRPVVFVGLISYSLYLWHWPVIVYQRLYGFITDSPSPVLQIAATIVVSFLLAVLSWRFVERPFRSPTRIPRKPLFGLAAAASAVIAGVALVALTGLPQRYPPTARQAAALLAYEPWNQYRTGECMISSGYDEKDFAAACLRRSATQPNILLIGDSHAAHLWYGLDAVLPGANVMQATASGCKPFVRPAAREWVPCRQVMDRVFDGRDGAAGIDKMLVAARWAPGDQQRIAETLDWAKGRGLDVVLIGPVVQYRNAVPRVVANALRDGDRDAARDLDAQRLSDLRALDRSLASLAAAKGVEYVSLWSNMCRFRACLAFDEKGEPLQFDYGHLTAKGSRIVARLIAEKSGLF